MHKEVDMTEEERAWVNDFASRCFRDTADADYIAARSCYRIGLFDQFLWLGLQALAMLLSLLALPALFPLD